MADSTTTKKNLKRHRHEKRKHAEIEVSENMAVAPVAEHNTNPSDIDHGNDDNEGRARKKSRRSKKPTKSSWKISEPVGGLLADLLPIFSPDEEHLLLGYSHSVKVYSSATSMLVRNCQTGGAEVSPFCLSRRSADELYILLRGGKIQLWNWTTGRKLKTWDLGGQVSDIAVSTLHPQDDADTVFIAESRNGSSEITSHRLLASSHEMAAKCLFRDKQSIKAIRTLDYGRYIVAVTSYSVIVGTRLKGPASDLKQLRYTFNTFATPEKITCFDAQTRKQAGSQNSPAGSLDVAVGLVDGSIRVYYDAASSGDQKTKPQFITPKNEKLHWHRQAVSSVAWALNGNYLLSGGSETVLVLWQLDTNAKTTLPHLMSSIEAITVSPKGSSYAIRQADNSVMTLATGDFMPSFNTAGIALPSAKPYDEEALTSLLPRRRAPVTCSLLQPPRLISAVPSDIDRRGPNAGNAAGFHANTNVLSFPLSSMTTSVSRQALVDNHATDVRRTQNGKLISTAIVVLLEVSRDGRWMASVDEWFQPLEDILSYSIDEIEARTQQLSSFESNLVFWHWNDGTETWDRSTRIPDPHVDQDHLSAGTKSHVLDLIAESKQNTFWTLGSEGKVKQWRLRKKEGGSSRATGNTTDGPDFIWKCTKSVTIPYFNASALTRGLSTASSRLTISSDGSVFGATRTGSSNSEFTLFSIQADGTAQNLLNLELEFPGVSAALLDQYLILADCDSVIVRDLTDSTKWYKANFGSNAAQADLMNPPLLAVDHEHQTFAISVPRNNKAEGPKSNRRSRISIFSPLSSNPLAVINNQPLTAALISVPQQEKFHVLTTAAEIYTISPNLTQHTAQIPSTETKESDEEAAELAQQSNLLSNVFGNGSSSTSSKAILPAERSRPTIDVTELPATRIPWENIAGLNLEQPFTLPTTSAIQLMSALAMKA